MSLFYNDDDINKAERVAEQVMKSAENQARMISQTYRLNYNKIWRNPDPDVKPEDVIAALGQNAVKLFTITNQIMATADAEALQSLPAGYSWTPHEDGSIELEYPPQPPAAEPTPEPEIEPVEDNGDSV